MIFRERGRDRERERERERDIDVKVTHPLVASHICPNQGLNLNPSGVQDNAPTN